MNQCSKCKEGQNFRCFLIVSILKIFVDIHFNRKQNKLAPEVVVPTPKQANLIW
jgi:hypothetical protein